MTTRLFVALMTIAMCRLGSAATITVPDDYSTIAEAIAAAADNDTISIMPGIYNEHALNPSGKDITVQGSLDGDDNLKTTIDGQGMDSVFVFGVGQGDNTVLKNLIITGGNGTARNGGGGIKFENYASGTIEGCIIYANHASGAFGGGVGCGGYSHPTLINCSIQNNSASFGGGIHCSHGGTTITDCVITMNDASSGGGGIALISFDGVNVTVINGCSISANTSPRGGGAHLSLYANPQFNGCTFITNEASIDGGGIYVYRGDPTFNDCGIVFNTATENGGGICSTQEGNTITVVNGEIWNNTAIINGGGAFIDGGFDSELVLTNCTFKSNTPSQTDGSGKITAASPMTAVCCLNGACMQGTEVDCMAAGGTWLGESGLCNDCPSTCDGDITGDGQLGIHDLLIMLETWGPCP